MDSDEAPSESELSPNTLKKQWTPASLRRAEVDTRS